MDILEHKHKREGLAGTVVFHLILLLLFIFAGLKYPVPRPEQGIVVDFGTSDAGTGQQQPAEPGASENEVPDPVPETSTPASQPEESSEEEVLTGEEETIEIPDSESPENQTTEESQTEEKQTEEPEPEEEKKISEELSGALERFKNRDGGGSEGDDDDAVGDKGSPDGGHSDNYSGGAGGGGGDYSLGNRKALSKPKPLYSCEEEGTIVINIKVDRSGKTVDARLNQRESNTLANCLVEEAKKAAYKTKWESDSNARFEQTGKIIYRFVMK